MFDRLRAYANENGLADRIARLERSTVFLDEVSDVSVPGIEHRATPDDVAFIQFSSGSTSEPKGVILTHRNLTTNIDAIAKGVRARDDDASLSWMPLTHDMGLIGFHLTPLFEGVDHWLMPTALFVRRPGLWLAKTSEHRVSVTCSPNFGYMHYLKLARPGQGRRARPVARAHHLQWRRAHRGRPVPRLPRGARAGAPRAERDVPGVRPRGSEPCGDVSRSRARRCAVETLARGALGPGDDGPRSAGADDAVELVRVGAPVQGLRGAHRRRARHRRSPPAPSAASSSAATT